MIWTGIFCSALMLLFASAFYAPCAASSASAPSDKTVRVSANLPMTGELAVYGQCVQDGARMALQDMGKSAPQGPKYWWTGKTMAGNRAMP